MPKFKPRDKYPVDTSEGGLQVTTPVEIEKEDEPEVIDLEDQVDEVPIALVLDAPEEPAEEGADVVVSADVSNDPSATVAAALVWIGRIYNDAGVVSAGLSKHLPGIAAEPELHSFLHRMQIALGEFRHAVSQVEQSMSDRLREAIEHSVS